MYLPLKTNFTNLSKNGTESYSQRKRYIYSNTMIMNVWKKLIQKKPKLSQMFKWIGYFSVIILTQCF